MSSGFRPPRPAPHPRALGPIALLRTLAKNPIECWTTAHFEEPIVTGGFPFARVAVVCEPATIRKVLVEEPAAFRKSAIERRILSARLRQGLVAVDGEQWETQRHMLAPFFARKMLGRFAPAMEAAVATLIARWRARPGEALECKTEMSAFALDALMRSIFQDGLGSEHAAMCAAARTYFAAAGRIDPFDVIGLPDFLPRLTHVRTRALLRPFDAALEAAIARRRRALEADQAGTPVSPSSGGPHAEEPRSARQVAPLARSDARGDAYRSMGAASAQSGKPPLTLRSSAPPSGAEPRRAAPSDILGILLTARDPVTGRGMSEAEVKANVLTFFLAGQETTSTALTWALYLLSQSDEWSERVRAEARYALVGPPESIGERLVETRAVLDEAMRLYPPIVGITRTATRSNELAGARIARNTLIVISPYVLHRHQRLWNDPDLFDPARFLDRAAAGIDRYAYLPFGIGPRMCIGAGFALQEATLALATIIANFNIALVPDQTVWPQQRFTLRPRDPLWLRVEPIA